MSQNTSKGSKKRSRSADADECDVLKDSIVPSNTTNSFQTNSAKKIALDELHRIAREFAERSVSAVELTALDLARDLECSFDEGYLNQHIYSCLTCAAVDGGPVAVCEACHMSCHAGHQLEDLWVLRNFRCDCATARNRSRPYCLCDPAYPHFAHLVKIEDLLEPDLVKIAKFLTNSTEIRSEILNVDNTFNHNFFAKFCFCDSLLTEKPNDDLHQCGLCLDWFHDSCLRGSGEPIFKLEVPVDFQFCTRNANLEIGNFVRMVENCESVSIENLTCRSCVSLLPWFASVGIVIGGILDHLCLCDEHCAIEFGGTPILRNLCVKRQEEASASVDDRENQCRVVLPEVGAVDYEKTKEFVVEKFAPYVVQQPAQAILNHKANKK